MCVHPSLARRLVATARPVALRRKPRVCARIARAPSRKAVHSARKTRFRDRRFVPTTTVQGPPERRMRILLIEDNEKLSQVIQVCLEQHGYCVDVAKGAAEGDEVAFTERYDVIIVDVMLSDGDGIELCRRLRQRKVSAPIMILSVLATTADKVRGLDAGADDYLTKPFEVDELLARLRSLLRRSQAIEGGVLQAGDLKLNLLERKVYIADVPVRMSHKELALLEYLMRNPRKLLSRTMISESVWDMNYEPGSNVIDVYVSSLRRKIDRGQVRYIETVIGSGYRFLAEPEGKGSAVPVS